MAELGVPAASGEYVSPETHTWGMRMVNGRMVGGFFPNAQGVQQAQQLATLDAGGVGTPEYNLVQRAERDKVRGQYSELRRGLEMDIHKRGIGRSGFAADAMGRIGALEGGALADVQAGVTDRLSQYQAQQRELGLQMKMARAAQKKNTRNKKIGAGLGIAGLVLAPFTGGASLALTGVGAGMYSGG